MISKHIFSVKIRFWIKLFRTKSKFKLKYSQVSGFEMKLLQRGRIWIIFRKIVWFCTECCTYSPNLGPVFAQFAKFLCVHQKRSSFGIVLLDGVGFASQVTVLG